MFVTLILLYLQSFKDIHLSTQKFIICFDGDGCDMAVVAIQQECIVSCHLRVKIEPVFDIGNLLATLQFARPILASGFNFQNNTLVKGQEREHLFCH